MQLRKRPQAVSDLQEAAWYLLEQQNEALALRFLSAAESSFKKISEMPTLGAPYQPNNKRLGELRTWLVKGFEVYVIVYRVTAEYVEVIRVLHGARRWQDLVDDE
ncbi:MAG TPA: type II toxin-antitoxin system RelE/ParE family toxin [Gemmatales bacterium]|nr:type II toxin-antitoxin system RelE/ParE family toxin [Gemmatales bacterium]